MTLEIIETVVASNTEAVAQGADEAAKPGKVEIVGDTIIQLDTAGQLVELMIDVGGLALKGVHATGSVISDVLDAIPTLD